MLWLNHEQSCRKLILDQFGAIDWTQLPNRQAAGVRPPDSQLARSPRFSSPATTYFVNNEHSVSRSRK